MTPEERSAKIALYARGGDTSGMCGVFMAGIRAMAKSEIEAAVAEERQRCQDAVNDLLEHVRANREPPDEVGDRLDVHHRERNEFLRAVSVALNAAEDIAAAQEREACAKVVLGLAAEYHDEGSAKNQRLLESAATLIRARP